MPVRTDLLLTTDGDLPIGATLMTTGPSDLQHQRDAFASFPGEWKQFPANGVGTRRYLKSTGPDHLALDRRGRQALQADGYNVGKMTFTIDASGVLQINTRASR